MTRTNKYKLAYFVTHPIQYQAPLLKELSSHPDVILKVYFISNYSVDGFFDEDFGVELKWDVPLLDGYKYEFLPRIGGPAKLSFLSPRVYGIGRALREEKWDAVWFHGYAHYALILGIIKAFRMKIPVLFRAESNLNYTPQNFIKNKLIRMLIKRASGLLWVGTNNKEYYKKYGARDAQLFFTPYAVNNELFQKKANEIKPYKYKLKIELGLNRDIPIILFASKMSARKNAMVLFNAYEKIINEKNLIPAYLIFIGDGEQRQLLEQRVKELALSEYVKLLGFKNQMELPAYFVLCDLFVLPSEKEPFGLVVNEVMNAGKPIIATTDVGAAIDLIRNDNNGYVVKSGDVNGLKEAIIKALSDDKMLSEMGNESLRIINKWSFKEDVDGVISCLKALREQKR